MALMTPEEYPVAAGHEHQAGVYMFWRRSRTADPHFLRRKSVHPSTVAMSM